MGKTDWPETLRHKQIVLTYKFLQRILLASPRSIRIWETWSYLSCCECHMSTFSSVLAEGISRQHWWGVCGYTSWGLGKKAMLTDDSHYCSSVPGTSLRVFVHICLFCVMAHRVSEQMLKFQSKMLMFLLHPAHYMWTETFPLLWAFRSTLYLDIFVSR